MNRWRLIRDSFVKAEKKISSGADADSVPPQHKYTDLLTFLRPHIQHRRQKSNVRLSNPASTPARTTTPSPSISTASATFEVDEEAEPRPTSSRSAPSPVPPIPGPSTSRDVERSRSPRERPQPVSTQQSAAQDRGRRRRSPAARGDFQDRLLEVLQEPPARPEGPKVEAYFFALSLVPVMLRLSSDGLRKAKMEILTTLHQIEDQEKAAQAIRRPTPLFCPPPPPTAPSTPRVQPHFQSPQDQRAFGSFTQMLQDTSQMPQSSECEDYLQF
ncbi:DNA repair protein complementing XP-C cells-like [Cyprinodon tularosa]|uniref:DNA repair protein complementing XP-C cells-like n=1 Tax=Cyprinodon tularosa TaxID=77115 RepID=UPI0018E24336|nr:DNA repair protein complementing XP-C cells-like [Cyprinodon tularosa]